MIIGWRFPSGIFQERGPGVMGVALAEGMEVLENKRHATERSIGKFTGGLGPGLFEAFMNDRVELRIERFGAGNGGIDQLEWRGLASADEFGLCGGIKVGESMIDSHEAEATDMARGAPRRAVRELW